MEENRITTGNSSSISDTLKETLPKQDKVCSEMILKL